MKYYYRIGPYNWNGGGRRYYLVRAETIYGNYFSLFPGQDKFVNEIWSGARDGYKTSREAIQNLKKYHKSLTKIKPPDGYSSEFVFIGYE